MRIADVRRLATLNDQNLTNLLCRWQPSAVERPLPISHRSLVCMPSYFQCPALEPPAAIYAVFHSSCTTSAANLNALPPSPLTAPTYNCRM